MLKEIQQGSDQKPAIFQPVHLPSLSLPGPTSLQWLTQLHRGLGKSNSFLGEQQVSGEHVLTIAPETFTLAILDCPSGEAL